MADADACVKETKIKNSRNNKVNHSEYRQKKKAPIQSSRNENDFYITSRSDFQGQLKKVIKFFDDGGTEVVIHGLGAAVTRAANLSLQVAEKLSNTVVLSVATDTVQLQDEWEPVVDEELPFMSNRSSSALHITISRVPGFPV